MNKYISESEIQKEYAENRILVQEVVEILLERVKSEDLNCTSYHSSYYKNVK